MSALAYTAVEQAHLAACVEEMAPYHPQQDDPGFWRWLADTEEAEAASPPVSMHGYPHPDDIDLDSPSPAQLREIADGIECGKYRDDWL